MQDQRLYPQRIGRFIRAGNPIDCVVAELEDLNEFRFYKLNINWQKKCICGGQLLMYRHDGTILELCRRPDCRKTYHITRKCSYCDTVHDFEDVTCDSCEDVVIDYTTMKVTIDECSKAIKKINRQFKNGMLEESDWKAALTLNTEEKERCEVRLKEITETIDYQFTK